MNDEPRPQPKPWRFSATAAEMATDCMYAFSAKYELGIPEIPSRALHIGRLLATTVERYQTHCFELGVASDVTEIEAIARGVYAEQGQGVPLDVLDEVLKVGRWYVESYVLDLERLAGVEMWLPPTGTEPLVFAGREVVGKVDQLSFEDEGRLAIVTDQKSNWSVWSEDDAREKLQARLYPLLVMHSFPDVEEVEVVFQFIRWGVERRVRTSRAEAYIQKENFEALAQLMQRPGPRPATPGARCSYCGYVSRCPVFKAARENGVFVMPTDDIEARKVIETTLVLEAAIAQRRSVLRDYTSAHGSVSVNGVRVGYEKTTTPRVLTKQFRELAAEIGLDPDEWLTVPTTELRKLLKKRPSLEAIKYEETSTKFDTRRGEAEEAPV
jgi:hypothetical protein